MSLPRVYSSLTRISSLSTSEFSVESVARADWATGDYVAAQVEKPVTGFSEIELPTGRMRQVTPGDIVIGALGERYATLEATGTWREVGNDGVMQALTSAGLLGKMTSKSASLPNLLNLRYKGHVHIEGERYSMADCVSLPPERPFTTPTVLLVGTSMAAGKTTSARVIIRMLEQAGKRVVGAKVTGAGRYRDILSMSDAGADTIFDFVDVGLPSTVFPVDQYLERLDGLTAMIAGVNADVAVIEIGASPLEPYNGEAAIEKIRPQVKCTVLSASDPYAVRGVMDAFDTQPDIVGGVATSTNAGVDLVKQLTGVPAVNWLDPATHPAIRRVLEETLEIELGWIA